MLVVNDEIQPSVRVGVADASARRPRRRLLLSAVSILVAAGALAFAGVATFDLLHYSNYVLPGDSMEPTIRPGTHVWARPVDDADVTAGEIVVLRLPSAAGAPGSRAVSRIVAVAGQTVSIRNGRLFVDGRDAGRAPVSPPGAATTITIPADAVYVLGDNRPYTGGSNQYGPVPSHDIVEHVVRIGAPTGVSLVVRLGGGLVVAAIAGLVCWRMLRRPNRVADQEQLRDPGPRPLWSS